MRLYLPLLFFFGELILINFIGWGKLSDYHVNQSLLITVISYSPYLVRGFIVAVLVTGFLFARKWSSASRIMAIDAYTPSRYWMITNLAATVLLAVFFLTIPPASEGSFQELNIKTLLFLFSPILWSIWIVTAIAWFYPLRQVGVQIKEHWKLVLLIVAISFFARGTVPGELPAEIYNKALYFWSELFLEPTLYVAMAISRLLNLDLKYWNDANGLLTFGNEAYHVGILGDCSGYEGITLVAILLAAYCYLERRNLKMPQAFVIFPLAMLSMFLLNVVRLIVLIEIGANWSPEIAMAGFHPVAGWVNLVGTLIIAAYFLNTSAFFSQIPKVSISSKNLNSADHGATVAHAESSSSLDAKYFLMPMVLWIGTSLVTQMFSSEFRWLYPLPVLIVGGFIYHHRANYAFLRAGLSMSSVLVGIAVFFIWVYLIPVDVEYGNKFEASLFSASPIIAALWLIFRIVGTSIMVPILEELAFRGFMQPQISEYLQKNILFSKHVATLIALLLTSVAFGFMHTDWFAGTVAGLCYGLLRLWHGKVGDAIVAHGVTNFILAMYVLFFGYWSYF